MEKVDVFNEEIKGFLPTIYKKLEWLDREELIKRFVSIEFNYLLDYYKNTRDINILADKERESQGMCRFFINLGRKQDLTPQLLIGMVNDISRSLSIKIGKIDIMHSFSFFEADADYKDNILKAFNQKRFKGLKIFAEEAEPYDGKKTKEKDYSGKRKKRAPRKKKFKKNNATS
jgi:ATP-dependent RNA helicase DeaD